MGTFASRQGSVLLRIVDMPEVDEETVFRLDFKGFDIEAYSSGVVGWVADQGVGAAFGGGVGGFT